MSRAWEPKPELPFCPLRRGCSSPPGPLTALPPIDPYHSPPYHSCLHRSPIALITAVHPLLVTSCRSSPGVSPCSSLAPLMRVPVMRALTGLLCLGLACMVCGQPTVPTFASISAPNGEPSNPSTPAAHGFYQPSQAAIDHLNRYTTVIELWFAGNSFDYLFGAFPGVRGIDDYNAGVAAGTYAPQKFASNAPSSLQVNSAYPALPYDFQGCQAAGAKQPCSPNVSLLYSAAVASNGGQPFPLAPIDMSSIISLANRVYTWGDPNEADGADSGAWRTDPEHGSLLNYLYALDGGANDGFIFWGSNGQDYTVPGYPQWSSRIGGTSLSYYNLSLPSNAALDGGTIPYLYQLAANYTLFDHFFASVMGASDVTFLGAAAGTLPPYDGVSSNCTAASNVFNTPNGTFTAQLCSYPAAGFASPAVIKGCSVLSDCTLVGELDGYLPSTWPQPAGPYNSSTCATVGFAPAIVDANHRLQPGNYGGDFLPPLSTRSMFSEMDDAGVKWAVYGKGLNSQIHGNFCDPEWPVSAASAAHTHQDRTLPLSDALTWPSARPVRCVVVCRTTPLTTILCTTTAPSPTPPRPTSSSTCATTRSSSPTSAPARCPPSLGSP